MMTTTYNTISDFRLQTLAGNSISNRLCIKDSIVVSWLNTENSASATGTIGFKGATDTSLNTLKASTSKWQFSPFDVSTGVFEPGEYILTFNRTVEEKVDDFSVPLTIFKTNATAGPDVSILRGQTLTLGEGVEDPNTTYTWTGSVEADAILGADKLIATVRPLTPGLHTYTLNTNDKEFETCTATDTVNVYVVPNTLYFSDTFVEDVGSSYRLSATLYFDKTYTKDFHFELKDTTNDVSTFVFDLAALESPYQFAYTVPKPASNTSITYTLNAQLGDLIDDSVATSFVCTNSAQLDAGAAIQADLIETAVGDPAKPSTDPAQALDNATLGEMIIRMGVFVVGFGALGYGMFYNRP